MKWYVRVFLAAVTVGASICGALVSTVSYAYAAPDSGTTTITATVAAVRLIVTNTQGTIIEVISNTPNETPPTVVIGTPNGSTAAYSKSIQLQYTTLKPGIDFTKYGVVYQRGKTFEPTFPLRAWDLVGQALI